MKNEVVENAAEALVWDSGLWADPTGKFSRPRVLSALRALEESGLVKIRGLTYMDTRTPIEEKPLPQELTITHKFVGWVEHKPIRKSTPENDFQDAKDLKPSKYK